MLTHLREYNKINDLLIDGYIYEQYGNHITDDVSKICQQYYDNDEIFTFTFDHQAISKLDYDQKLFANNDTVKIRGYTFRCFIQKMTWGKPYRLRMKRQDKLPSNCNKTQFYYETYCVELRDGDVGFRRRYDYHKGTQTFELGAFSIPKHVEHKQLHFRVYAVFMFIRYNDDTPDDIYRDIKLSKNINYKWKIDDELADKFINARKGQRFYSDNFGNINDEENNNVMDQFSFCLQFIPKIERKAGGHSLLVRFNALPWNLSKVYGDVYLNNGQKENVVTNAEYGVCSWQYVYITEANDIQDLLSKSREFSVKIDIKEFMAER